MAIAGAVRQKGPNGPFQFCDAITPLSFKDKMLMQHQCGAQGGPIGNQ